MGYPVEFRRKVFELKDEKGFPYEQISELFGVSMRTLFRWQTRIEIKKKMPKPRAINLEDLKNQLVESEKTKMLNMYSRQHYENVKRVVSIKFFNE